METFIKKKKVKKTQRKSQAMSKEEIKGTCCEDDLEREILGLCEYSSWLNDIVIHERFSQTFKINWLVSSSLETNVHEPLFP